MKRVVMCLAIMTLSPRAVSGQDNWDRYQPGTLGPLVAEVRATFVSGDTTGFGPILSPSDDHPTMAVLAFSGEFRDLSDEAKSVLSGWQKALRVETDLLTLFKQEALFREGELELWMPVQAQLVEPLKAEATVNQRILVLTTWLGAYHSGPSLRSIFVVNEFDASR